ncbi:hypothetical protein [Streptacidiphilus neutrinimicus]|uniref:hypothetical protein n=1 Tax=Streptacidiphilus neutrinimicus TaxID=105420 RepID=UPI0005A8CD3D|nr:hypothetical protein [Streptacidiphilus neutrinimicus]
MFRGRRVPDALLPAYLVRAWMGARADRVRARAREVHGTRDLGALSIELVLLVIGLIAVAGILVGVLTTVITDKSGSIK